MIQDWPEPLDSKSGAKTATWRLGEAITSNHENAFIFVVVIAVWLVDVIDQIEEMPDHIGFILDGNRRFAVEQGWKRTAGHYAGAEKAEDVYAWCNNLDISEVTYYMFSMENFSRSLEELDCLFNVIYSFLHSLVDDERIHGNGVRVEFFGNVDLMPSKMQQVIEEVRWVTKEYSDNRLNLAVAYSGREEMIKCARRILRQVRDGEIDIEEIDQRVIEENMYPSGISPIDLLVRTAGERRTSGFFPWYCHGQEAVVYFPDRYWPEFSKSELHDALRKYARFSTRHRGKYVSAMSHFLTH